MSALLPLDVAQQRLLGLVSATTAETVPLGEAQRRYLAAPLVAGRTQPAARLSAMDGFAVCGDGPWTVIGESRCGSPFAGPITAGQAAKISPGAPPPHNPLYLFFTTTTRYTPFKNLTLFYTVSIHICTFI